jgi:hypothetical protein
LVLPLFEQRLDVVILYVVGSLPSSFVGAIQRSLDDFVARFKSHVLIIVSDGFLSATPTRITDSRWERALAANPVREQPGASILKRGAAVRVPPLAMPSPQEFVKSMSRSWQHHPQTVFLLQASPMMSV